MNLPEKFYLSTNVPPVIFMHENEANNFVYELQCAPGRGAVRVIRGWKCPNYDALHNEVAAALQFPGYYGENWDAMDECINDLAWMPAQWYLIHVNGVELVLPEDEKNFNIFLKVLHRAGLDFAHPESRGVADVEVALSKPFNTIISGSEEGLLRARKALDLHDASGRDLTKPSS
jgi:RNAse (barnase) inhibitor barstar